MAYQIPFNKPFMSEHSMSAIREAYRHNHVAGDGHFTEMCHSWFEQEYNVRKALLTHSCTASLEIAAMLLDLEPGDEVIMPSFTFVSTANAVVRAGGVPVFVDIRDDTLNLDETLIESAITSSTKAIMVVHYAGVGAEMDAIMSLASEYGLYVVEDAAQCIGAEYRGSKLGAIGDLGAFSFHETKNITSGEGGMLLTDREHLWERAEIIREKGTNRSKFRRGEVDKYTWVDVGSSYLPGETTAAFLYGQLDHVAEVTEKRRALCSYYDDAFADLARQGMCRRPIVPDHCYHNGHIYYLRLSSQAMRDGLREHCTAQGITAVFHYVPLHSSPAGRRYGKVGSSMEVTDQAAADLLRLPVFYDLSVDEQDHIVRTVREFLDASY